MSDAIKINWTFVICTAIVCAAALCLGFYVWPTPYEYKIVNIRRGTYEFEYVLKINRFTGVSQLRTPTGLIVTQPLPQYSNK